MNTKNLTTLITILETGSFQKAAAKLNYTQSTVTFQIKQLEEELSIKLFEKIGRHMELTQAGKDLLPYIHTILQSVEQISNYKKDMSEITGSLRLVAPDSILIYLLQPVIKEILHRAPKIRLIVNSIPSEEINQAILEGSADIGIDCDKGGFPDSVIHKAANPFYACLIAPPFTGPFDADFITPNQEKKLSLIQNEWKANYQKLLFAYLEKKNIIMEPGMTLRSIEAVKKSVMNGLGIAYVPSFSVQDELKAGSLIQLKTELDEHLFPGVCVYHKNKWISPQMDLALKVLSKHIGIEYP